MLQDKSVSMMKEDRNLNREKPVSLEELNEAISRIIKQAELTKETNNFFKAAKSIKKVDAYSASLIASNWREITRTFSFTTLVSMGKFSETMSSNRYPDKNLLKVLQTSMMVISDDFNNIFSVFQKIAPKGSAGIHYIWWEETILNPLKEACRYDKESPLFDIFPKTQSLLDAMIELSKNPFGFALQLYIVETIALDIVLAFRPLFSAVEVNNKKVFPERSDMEWIYSHITAEVIHRRQVSDIETGMLIIATTLEEQKDLLRLAQWYTKRWAEVFDEFVDLLEHPPAPPKRNLNYSHDRIML